MHAPCAKSGLCPPPPRRHVARFVEDGEDMETGKDVATSYKRVPSCVQRCVGYWRLLACARGGVWGVAAFGGFCVDPRTLRLGPMQHIIGGFEVVFTVKSAP